ncbi:hypothetical protein SAMN05660464_1124 [Geodermatophilus dictyosporus]|uniref:VanZ like family protein n=1 Tax=Geodermatophilus dictyosporus TaxID=1523247 RepID=A0A1I5JY29_9ACTN|nr:hypothetical protein [Geodermatophilus dictyosporus]SFO77695.1 hypothetical protein SAMN05660464_1124 [Geodermatophilus dictyosporus]
MAAAALAARLWPGLGSPGRLVAAALATGGAIEALQFLLSLGRVVSPLDALLNAVGAMLAGLLVTRADGCGAPPVPVACPAASLDGGQVAMYR